MSKEQIIQSIIDGIKEVLPGSGSPNASFELHEPRFTGNELNYLKQCVETGWVSSLGEFVTKFEKDLSNFTGASHAIATSNGTAALHTCLMLVDVKPGDEVLVPALTFVATGNVVAYCAATPNFYDSEPHTLGVNVQKLREYLASNCRVVGSDCVNKATGRRIRALIAMHTFGHPCDLAPLKDLCLDFKIRLIEDAAESLGSYYKGVHTGLFGEVAALSINGNKIVTTGGGGAILTSDPEIARRARHLTTTAKVSHQWGFFHDQVGYNYRMPNINAALGCAQMESIGQLIENKRRLAARYQNVFNNIPGVRIFKEANYARSNYWLNVLLLEKADVGARDRVLAAANAVGIKARPAWTLLYKLPMFQTCPRTDMAGSELIENSLINLPSSPHLGKH